MTVTCGDVFANDDTAINNGVRNTELSASLSNNAIIYECNENETIDDVPLAELTLIESYTVTNDVLAINTGVISPPPIGMSAAIENTDLRFYNFGTTVIENSVSVDEALTQDNDIQQTLVLRNNATAENTGTIVAGSQGVVATIANADLGFINLADLYNFNEGTIDGDLTQSADATQSARLENVVDVANSGPIVDPDVGIEASIYNFDVVLRNDAEISNLNTADFANYNVFQTAGAEQSNALINEAGVSNSGPIVAATFFGIQAGIANRFEELQNVADIDNTNQGHVNGDLTQSAEIAQDNLLDNAILIVSAGSIDPNEGIDLAILNETVDLSNNVAVKNLNDNEVSFDLIQSASVAQDNTFANRIDLSSTSDIAASDVGIGARIQNIDLGLINLFDIENNNYFDVYGNLTQSADVDQANALTNDILIVNRGDIGDLPSFGGVYAEIRNGYTCLCNDARILNYNDDDVEVDLEQTALVAQSNLWTNTLAIDNRDSVTAGETGIFARIYNEITDLGNYAFAGNTSPDGEDIENDLIQSANVTQSNALESGVLIVNRDNLTAGPYGIQGIVTSGSLNLTNVVDAGGAGISNSSDDDVDGDATQSAALAQSNAIDNGVSIDNRAAVLAEDFAAFGRVRNGQLLLRNLAVIGNATRVSGFISDDLSQSVDAAQSNALANAVVILNSTAAGAYTGLFGEIENTVITLENQLTIDNLNENQADQVVQATNAGQSNAFANGILIENSGGVDASGFAGLYAQIFNYSDVRLWNELEEAGNLNQGDTVKYGANAQTLDMAQSNAFANLIEIANDGPGIDGNILGITAFIVNNGPSLYNRVDFENVNEGEITGDLVQSQDVAQSNAFTNMVIVDTAGDIGVVGQGARARAQNTYLLLTNSALLSNVNDGTGPISSDLTESANVAQTNTFANGVNIINSGMIDPVTGIHAESTNVTMSLSNSAVIANNNNGAVGTTNFGGDFTQMVEAEQRNVLVNSLSTDNRGAIAADNYGVFAQIYNLGLSLSNAAIVNNLNGGTGTVVGDLVQSTVVSQTNILANSIVAANNGSIASDNVGMFARIDNDGITLANSLAFALSIRRTSPATSRSRMTSIYSMRSSTTSWW